VPDDGYGKVLDLAEAPGLAGADSGRKLEELVHAVMR